MHCDYLKQVCTCNLCIGCVDFTFIIVLQVFCFFLFWFFTVDRRVAYFALLDASEASVTISLFRALMADKLCPKVFRQYCGSGLARNLCSLGCDFGLSRYVYNCVDATSVRHA